MLLTIPTSSRPSISNVAMLILILLSALATSLAIAGSDTANYRFSAHHNDKLDLIGGHWSTVEDPQGFLWFGGTAGLARYDGYSFVIYKHDPKDPQSLSNNTVKDLLVTKSGELWIATAWGLNRFHPETNTFEHFLHNPKDTNSLSHNDVINMSESADGSIWLATTVGVSRFYPATQQFSHLHHNPDDANSLAGEETISILEDSAGIVWIGTKKHGLNRYSPRDGKFTHFPHQPDNPSTISHSHVLSLHEDHNHTLWLGTFGGLNRFNPETQSFTRIQHDPTDGASISGNVIRDIHEDLNHNLWLAVDGGGLNILDRKALTAKRFSSQTTPPHQLTNDQVRSIYEDNSGTLWFGHYPAGLSNTNFYASAFQVYRHESSDPNSLSHSDILSVAEDKQGDLWLGTEKGLNHINRKTGAITSYQHDPNDPTSLKMNPVKVVFIDSQQNIWTGTWRGGMSLFNRAKGNFTHFPELRGSVVQGIIEGSDGLLWIGTNLGLSSYNRQTNTFNHYAYEMRNGKKAAATEIYTLFEDQQQKIWLGRDDNLTRFDRKDATFTHFFHDTDNEKSISAGSIRAIFEDSTGTLWAGSGGNGINRFDPATETFMRYTVEQGLADNKIGCIIEDTQDHLWIGTGHGLSRFEPSKGHFQNYTSKHGLAGNLHKRPGCMALQSGEIVFGSTKGLTLFNPDKIIENVNRPPLVFTDFYLFNKPVQISAHSGLLTQHIMYTDRLVLDHTQSVFSFDFVALNYIMPERNQYAYQLEGFDKDWVHAGNRRSTTYTNLDPGHYTFKVKGSNNEGVWNEEGVSIEITILPPWWQTWWAYTLYICVLLALVIRFLYLQKRKREIVEEQNRLLEIKVAERTQEIRRKKDDIQSMLSNMQQGLFTIEHGGSIHPEYSHHLELIFEQQSLAGQPATALLFENSSISNDRQDQISAAINSIIGEDEFFFEINGHLLINEYTKRVNEKTKLLSLDWSSVTKEGAVDRLMVTVRDITEIRKVENESRAQKRELDIISQLIHVTPAKYMQFEEAALGFIRQNQELINNSEPSVATTDTLFRNMHTIKGNSRTYGFKFLSDAAHTIESHYAEFRSADNAPWNKTQLLSELDNLTMILTEYATVLHQVFGQQQEQGQITLSRAEFLAIQEFISEANTTCPQLSSYQAYQQVTQIINGALYTRLHTLVDSLASSLPEIAESLGKPAPLVVINDSGLCLTEKAHKALTNALPHLLRNAIDHGIESPLVRAQHSKAEQGKITIEAKATSPETVAITISDDGAGLNRNKLMEKAKSLRNHEPDNDESIPDSELVEIIFQSGVSTKETVSEISGRGVGMDAVRHFIQEAGGSIHIATQTSSTDPEQLACQFVIELPSALFH